MIIGDTKATVEDAGRLVSVVYPSATRVRSSRPVPSLLFSMPPKRAVPNRPFVVDLADGSFIGLAGSDNRGAIDHFDVGVDSCSPEPVAARLRQAGLDDELIVGPNFVFVEDADGIRAQIPTVE